MNLSRLWEIVEDRGAWHAVVNWVTKKELDTTWQLNNNSNSKLYPTENILHWEACIF